MVKHQFNIRITGEARELLELLIEHFTSPETGRKATQGEVFERAIRILAEREQIRTPTKKR